VIFALGITAFIASNPGLIAWLLGVLFTALAGMSGTYYKIIYKRLGVLGVRVSEVERTLLAMPGREAVAQLGNGIDDLKEQMRAMQLENIEAHGKIVSDHGQRLARIESRMPNGELTEMLRLLRSMVKGDQHA